MLRILNKTSDAVNRGCKAVCAVMMAYLAVVCTLQVVFRRVLNNSLTWSEETMRYVFVWMILLATAVTVKEGSGAAIDLLKKRLKNEKAIAVHEIILFLLTGFTAGILVKYGIEYSLAASGMSSTAVHLPMSLIYASIPVGSMLTVLHCINGIAEGISKLCGKTSITCENGGE